ncbi:MAG TPA: primosomal protein N' [Epulopiscium sp.]|nr:primosomal protein N' [Candidatus Epulonipiscium sp.]
MIDKYAQVLMEFATTQEIDRTFTYKIPEDLMDTLKVGMRVLVPFGRGNKTQEGYVISFTDTTKVPTGRMKKIYSIIDQFEVFSPNMLNLGIYMQSRYGCTLASALDVMLPPGSKGKPITLQRDKVKVVQLAKSDEDVRAYMGQIQGKKSLMNQYYILELLLEMKETPKQAPQKDIRTLLQIGESAFNTLNKNNITTSYISIEEYRPAQDFAVTETGFLVNEEQEKALEYLHKTFFKKAHETVLLHGITGSGKTEIFLQLIDTIISKGYEAIVLVPEISLTPQTVNRFRRRFGNKVGITHSRLTPKERMNQWVLAKEGKISVMIGPRSAVFTPFQNLKLIVMDEEHETTYKSETTPKYHTKEVAKYRMEQESGILLLASATPDLETYYKTETNKYTLLELTKRVYNRPLPSVEFVDMRLELASGNKYVFSNRLHEEIQKTIDRKEQVILFLNRRGHSTFISCRSCGYVIKCNHCNITMTYHSKKQNLMCHYCGKHAQNPKVCPACQSKFIRYFGDGTQKVEEEAKMFFPNARVGRMDMDTTTKNNSHETILKDFKDGKIDILVGTQMIAKGHDFPNVTLVGVMAADNSLYMQDYRATERTFQLLTQVTGRAGRGDKLGHVMVQTYNPDHYCLQIAAKQDYEAFYKEEILLRKHMKYPPFSHIFSVLITSDKEEETIRWAQRLMEYYTFYNKNNDFELYGPIPAAISKIADIYRWRIIIKSNERTRLNSYGLYCIHKLKELDKPSTIQIQSDIDPIMLY